MKPFSLAVLLLAASLLPVGAEDKKITVGEFSFATPSPWTPSENTGMMTAAVLNYPVKEGKPLEAKFYAFPGGGGGVDANLERWSKQFEGTPDIKKEELDFNGTKVVLLTASGTFLDGGPMSPVKTPRPDYALLGAILVGKDVPVFIKLTGPKADVAGAQEAFKKLVTSPFAK
jgi:hypothetical protein